MIITISLILIYASMIAFLLVGYIYKSIAIINIAKKRGIDNAWMGFIPILQGYVFGDIYDNINEYHDKITGFGAVLRFINLVCCILLGVCAYRHYVYGFTPIYTTGVFLLMLRIFNLKVAFKIYKDYSPQSWILLGVLSILFGIDFMILFCIRKNVPVSMCFTQADEWMFESNKPALKMLWNQYHYSRNKQTWYEFLLMNFTPVQFRWYQPNG